MATFVGWAVRLIQGFIAALVAVGLFRGDLVLAVNGIIGLGTAALPAALERAWDIRFRPEFVLWIAITVLLHTLGMTGPYETIWWWDHLTHTLSGALLASVGYAIARALDDHAPGIYLPRNFLVLYVILFTMAAGVLWEVLEFVGRHVALSIGQQPLLVQYGLQDTVLDLCFDGMGAIVVGLLGQHWAGTEVLAVVKRRLTY